MTPTDLEKRIVRDITNGSPLILMKEICLLVRDTDPYRVKRKYLEGLPKDGRKYYVRDVAERVAKTIK